MSLKLTQPHSMQVQQTVTPTWQTGWSESHPVRTQWLYYSTINASYMTFCTYKNVYKGNQTLVSITDTTL